MPNLPPARPSTRCVSEGKARGHTAIVQSVAFALHDKLTSAGWDKAAKFYRLRSARPIPTHRCSDHRASGTQSRRRKDDTRRASCTAL